MEAGYEIHREFERIKKERAGVAATDLGPVNPVLTFRLRMGIFGELK
jgi:hypothetical protein